MKAVHFMRIARHTFIPKYSIAIVLVSQCRLLCQPCISQPTSRLHPGPISRREIICRLLSSHSIFSHAFRSPIYHRLVSIFFIMYCRDPEYPQNSLSKTINTQHKMEENRQTIQESHHCGPFVSPSSFSRVFSYSLQMMCLPLACFPQFWQSFLGIRPSSHRPMTCSQIPMCPLPFRCGDSALKFMHDSQCSNSDICDIHGII